MYQRQPVKKRVGFLIPELLQEDIIQIAQRGGVRVHKKTGQVYLASTVLGLLATGLSLYPGRYAEVKAFYQCDKQIPYQVRMPLLMYNALTKVALETNQKVFPQTGKVELSGVILSLLHCAVSFGHNSLSSFENELKKFEPELK